MFTVYVDAKTLPLATVGPGGPYEDCDWREWLDPAIVYYVAAEVEMAMNDEEPDDELLDAVRFYKRSREAGMPDVIRRPVEGPPALVTRLTLFFKPGVVGAARVLLRGSAEE